LHKKAVCPKDPPSAEKFIGLKVQKFSKTPHATILSLIPKITIFRSFSAFHLLPAFKSISNKHKLVNKNSFETFLI